LAVVRELVRLHGAELDVHSTLGVGSVFAVTFPVITEKNAEEAR
jgi:signal transduction histidine kinase